MSLKGQHTTADYIDWNAANQLIWKLGRDNEYSFMLLVGIGIYCGLRVSDILQLRWVDLLNMETMVITEKKTGKTRTIPIHNELQRIVTECWSGMAIRDTDQFIFMNRKGHKVISTQYINRRIKQLMKKYDVTNNNLSIKTHSLRKTFGRQVFNKNQHSEKGLIILSEVFGHSTPAVTKAYLGIRQDEISDIYTNL